MMTKLREATQIVSIEARGTLEDVGAEAMKRMPPGSRYRYKQTVVYSLGDGVEIEGSVRAQTKPKLTERLANEFRYVENRMMYADQWDNDGEARWSISTRFSLNLR